jgi:hypothetical protein
MTSQTQSNIQVTLLLLLLFCPVSEVTTADQPSGKQHAAWQYLLYNFYVPWPHWNSLEWQKSVLA